MKAIFEDRNCMLESGSSEDVKEVLQRNMCVMPIGFLIVPSGDERWSVFRENSRTPRINMSCVDKLDGVLRRIEYNMWESYGRALFVLVEGEMGIRGMNYFLEID